MTAGLNDIVVLEVAGLKSLLDRAKCLDEKGNKVTTPCREKNILLFIEGRPLRGMKPESGAPELTAGTTGTLRYHLQRPLQSDTANYADAKEHWADLLGLSLAEDGLAFTRDVSMSVGIEDEYPIDTDIKGSNSFHLLRVHSMRLLGWTLLLLLCLYIFWRLARESDIIRDRKPVLWKQLKPYSLSQSQAAWWLFFVVVGFVFIWLVTGQYDLSTSALVLLGIGFATAIGSTVIDQNKKTTPLNTQTAGTSELTTLLQEKTKIEGELDTLEQAARNATAADKAQAEANLTAKEQEYNDKIKVIRTKYPNALGWPHKEFLTDILSDDNGVSFHRFQMMVWTIVLGFIFIHAVLSRLSMPEFSTTLLTLMGISNGTYLIGKSTEPQVTNSPQPAGGAAGGGGGAAAAGGAGGSATGGAGGGAAAGGNA